LYGGAGWGALSLSTGTLLVASVFFLSLRYGARSITNSDTVILFLSLSAVGMWWLTNNPLYSILMVTAIDAMGYVPTLRKSWDDPWSETLLFWLAMAVGSLLSILSLDEINWLTAPYLITLATLNTVVLLVCKFRRNSR
jgi:hypothetical protein